MSFEVTRQELLKQANELLQQYNKTRNPETKAQEVRIRKIVVDLDYIATYGSQNLQQTTDLGSTTTNSITANAFIKSGGTSSQFLKADGSVDSSTYLSTADVLNSFLLMGG
jgi:activator of HSP90 ATPase